MLTSTSTESSKKQIVVSSSGKNTNTTLYTVPSGKTFVGHILATVTTGWVFRINGVESPTQSATTAYYAEMFPLTLVGGSTVGTAGSTYNWMLIGVEE